MKATIKPGIWKPPDSILDVAYDGGLWRLNGGDNMITEDARAEPSFAVREVVLSPDIVVSLYAEDSQGLEAGQETYRPSSPEASISSSVASWCLARKLVLMRSQLRRKFSRQH